MVRIYMRGWRNRQTRTFEVRVGNHGGSNPLPRTKKPAGILDACRFLICRFYYSLIQTGITAFLFVCPLALSVFLRICSYLFSDFERGLLPGVQA